MPPALIANPGTPKDWWYLTAGHLKMGLISLAHGNCERAGYWFKNGCNIANGIVKKMACRWNATPCGIPVPHGQPAGRGSPASKAGRRHLGLPGPGMPTGAPISRISRHRGHASGQTHWGGPASLTNLRFVNEDCPAACLRTVPQFSMVVPLRSQARLWHSLLHWAYSAPVSRTARAPSCAPRLRRPGVPALRTALAFGGAVFRRCGRPLGVSSRLQPLRGLRLRTDASLRVLALQPLRASTFLTGMHFYPQFAIVDLHRTQSVACGSRCSLGSLRPVSVPHMRSVPATLPLASLLCSLRLPLRLFRALARGEAPSHRRRPPCAPQKMPEMTYTPSDSDLEPRSSETLSILEAVKNQQKVFHSPIFSLSLNPGR